MKNKKLIVSLVALFMVVGLLAGCSSDEGLLSNAKKLDLTTQVKNDEGGSIDISPSKDGYSKNEKVTLNAVADVGYEFSKWSGDVDSKEPGVEVVMDSDKKVIAEFAKTDSNLMYFWNHAKGNVTKEIVEAEGSYESDTIESGTKVKLTAEPKEGYVFSHWEIGQEGGENIGDDPELTITVDEGTELYARFERTKELVSSEDAEIGEVKVENTYPLKSTEKGYIQLTANPKNSGVFQGWEKLPDEKYIVEHSAPTVEESRSIVLKGFEDGVDTKANFEKVEGAFKVVNSWGAEWGPFEDGTLHMTYAAAANANLMAFVQEKSAGYEPQAIATFDLSGSDAYRKNVELEVQALDTNGDVLASKNFYPFTFIKGGDQYFPDNLMAMDITEVLVEAKKETEEPVDIVLDIKIDENDSYGTVKVNSFGVEIYGDGYSTDPVDSTNTESASDLPEEVVNAGTAEEEIEITGVSLADIDENADILSASNNLERNAREITSEDVEKIMDKTKTDDLSNRTGLITLNEDQWKTAREDNLIKMLGDLNEPSEEEIDLTETQHFPPIGDQAAEGSCVAWGVTYYARTYNAAVENDWDFSGETYETAEESKLMSPEFTYQMINGGEDGGSIYFDAVQMNKHLGTPSLKTMPYDDGTATAWASEEAWREAPKYRNPGSRDDVGNGYFITIDDVDDINTIKALIAKDYLVTISIDANKYDPEVWTVENYVDPVTNHANTIAGYNDNFNLDDYEH